MGVRAVEEAEGGLEEACRELPCGDGSDGEVVREARRAWAKPSSPEGKNGARGPGGSLGERAAEGGWR